MTVISRNFDKEQKSSLLQLTLTSSFQAIVQHHFHYQFAINFYKSSVVRQKGESQNAYFKKTKHVKFSEKRSFFTPWHACISGGKKWSFFGKFDLLCFLETPFLRFTLLPYYRQNVRHHTSWRTYLHPLKSHKSRSSYQFHKAVCCHWNLLISHHRQLWMPRTEHILVCPLSTK